jgi:hypothetical protein
MDPEGNVEVPDMPSSVVDALEAGKSNTCNPTSLPSGVTATPLSPVPADIQNAWTKKFE